MRKENFKMGIVDDIGAIARSLNEIYNQLYMLHKPIVDDVCEHPESVTENELEHLFDSVLEIANDKGKRLFDKLCNTFSSRYPDCVKDYIRFEHELY